MPSTPDSQVRELLAKGDNDSAATLAIRALGPPVLRYLRAILRDEDDTKDAFSHWAEGMWRGLPGFHWESSLQTWAYRHAYHAALGLRDEAWRRHRRRFETGEASRIAATIRTSTGVRVERQRAILLQVREALTLEEQTLLGLRIDQGLPWEAIAEVLGREGHRPDAGTVAKRFERLKARLGEMLKRGGVQE